MILQIILSLCASSAPTPVSDEVVRSFNTTTSTKGGCNYIATDDIGASSDVDDFIASLEREHGEDFLAEGRQWVADTFYADQPQSIASLRLAKGWSQARLAKEADTTQAQISKIERGMQSVGTDTIGGLARALGADPEQIFKLIFTQRESRVV